MNTESIVAETKSLRHNHALYSIYVLGFFWGLYTALPAYIDSSFLSLFGTQLQVSTVYSLGSIATIIGFLLSFPLVRRYGNYRMMKWLLMGQILMLAGLIIFHNIYLLGPIYIVNMMLINLTSFCSDIFIESRTVNKQTGKVRGSYLTFLNFAWLAAPTLASTLVVGEEYWRVYAVAALFILPIIYIIRKNFKNFIDPEYPKMSIAHAISKFAAHKDFRMLSVANVSLYIFYSWMTIYMPIYLHQTIGFSWIEIGFIFTIMLLPFVLVEIPLGRLADKKWGEKEFMFIGMLIMAISTGALSFITSNQIWLWALMLFMTRIGASMLEIMIETYFFKKIHLRDSNILSVFRISRPFAYLLGPVLFSILGIFISFNFAFLALGIICLSSLPFIFRIKDTA